MDALWPTARRALERSLRRPVPGSILDPIMAREHELFAGWLQDFVNRARIECDQFFEVRCPLAWGALEETEDPAVRRCDECKKPVYLVTSEAQLIERAERGECAAIVSFEELPDRDDQLEDRPAPMMGMVMLPPSSLVEDR